MNRRNFVKLLSMAWGAVVLLPGRLLAKAEKAAAPASSGASGTVGLPDYAKDMLHSDMDGIGPDGKPTGQKATYTGASKANAKAEEAMKHKMKLTKEEQAILDGKDGEEKAKLMRILVTFGNTFGAEKLVDLGGAPHSNMFIGAPYMKSMIKMLDECAKAGLKSYATYTVNPRPFDLYNVNLKEALDFIVFASDPKRMAVMAELNAYAPVRKSAMAFIDDSVRKYLPTSKENADNALRMGYKWWITNKQAIEIEARFAQWRVEKPWRYHFEPQS